MTLLALLALVFVQRIGCAEIRYLDPEAQTPFARPTRSELGLLGVNVHQMPSEAALRLVSEVGFRFARTDLLWSQVERRGAYRFSDYDALLNALEEHGMGALWILDYGHPDHGGAVPRTAEDIGAFGRFAAAAAAHFEGHDVLYEIWNEPDIEHFWPPAPNAEEYAALLKQTLAAIHKADPAARVVSGGVSRFDLAFLRRAITPEIAAGLSAIGVHPYPKSGTETIAPDLAHLRTWIRGSFGDRMEIWDTEWGYSSTMTAEGVSGNGHSDAGRMRQASLAVREILTVWSVGFPLAVWYDLRDDGPNAADPEQNYGLLDVGGNPKPAMQAVRTVMAAAKNRQYTGLVGDAPGELHVMRFDGSSDVLFIVWSGTTQARREVRFTKENLLSITDLMGNALKTKDGTPRDSELTVDATAGPIYLLWKRARQANGRP